MPMIELTQIQKFYEVGEITVKAIKEITLEIVAGEFISIMGPSGSGKSTTMNILGCLDRATGGQYLLDGIDTQRATNSEFAEIRNQKIGFVFQGFNLLARTTALENVELPLLYSRKSKVKNIRARAVEVLKLVGLESRMDHIPSQLSGGQQQRVAIARALVNHPSFILADEPTGNLDSEMSLEVMDIFQKLNAEGKTIVMVTHEPEIAAYTKRVVTMRDGLIVEDKKIEHPNNAHDDLVRWREAHHVLAQ